MYRKKILSAISVQCITLTISELNEMYHEMLTGGHPLVLGAFFESVRQLMITRSQQDDDEIKKIFSLRFMNTLEIEKTLCSSIQKGLHMPTLDIVHEALIWVIPYLPENIYVNANALEVVRTILKIYDSGNETLKAQAIRTLQAIGRLKHRAQVSLFLADAIHNYTKSEPSDEKMVLVLCELFPSVDLDSEVSEVRESLKKAYQNLSRGSEAEKAVNNILNK